jgi:peptidoglycan/LPS O-acetylase OafA/YrhL
VNAKQPALHIPSLDGIRAISFLVVFLAHAGLGRIVPGYFGLTLFFFLSGYLITTLLRLEFDKTGGISLKQFYLRRVMRIFPPFYLVLATASILVAVTGFPDGSLRAGALTAQVFHLTNYYIIRHGWWDGMAPGTWVYWSLAIEEHFYLFFPLAYVFLRRYLRTGRQQALALLALCGLVLAWRGVLVFALHASRERTYVATDTRVDSIVAGCILAVWRNPALDRESVDGRNLMCIWLPLGTAAVLLSLVVHVPEFDQTLRYTLQSFGVLPFFIAAVRWHDRGIFRLLNLAPVRYIGVVSYSLYLMHTPMLWALGRWTTWRPLPRGSIAFGGLVFLATLMYQFVEKPSGRMRRRLERYMEPGAGVRAAPSHGFELLETSPMTARLRESEYQRTRPGNLR